MISIKRVTKLIQSHLFYGQVNMAFRSSFSIFLVGELFMNLIELSECF